MRLIEMRFIMEEDIAEAAFDLMATTLDVNFGEDAYQGVLLEGVDPVTLTTYFDEEVDMTALGDDVEMKLDTTSFGEEVDDG